MRMRLLALPKRRSPAHDQPAAIARTATTPAYAVVDLQLPGSTATLYPSALNNAGRIVGADSSNRAFIINADGTGAYLENPSDPVNINSYVVFPTSVSNNGGTASGEFYINYPDGNSSANGGLIWTLTGATGSSFVETPDVVTSIANQNVAVGDVYSYDLSGKSTTLLTNPCGRKLVIASSINDSGLIGGQDGVFEVNSTHAVVMKIGGCPTAVPNLGPGYSSVVAVNKNGDLLIDEYLNGAALWKQGKLYPIPLPPGYSASDSLVEAYAFNASDVIVGTVISGPQSVSRAFVYANGKSVDLGSLFPANSGWQPADATGINDGGEIIGSGYENGVLAGFALRP